MEVAVLIAVLVGLALLRRNATRGDESGAKPSVGDKATPPKDKATPPKDVVGSSAILWAHKTGAGFVCVGYAQAVGIGATEKTIHVIEPTMLHPGFVNPGIEPETPGYVTGPTLDFSPTDLQAVENGAGAYQILAPLNFAGFLGSDDVALMVFADMESVRKMRKKYLSARKNWSVGRTWPFKRSKLYRLRVPFGVLANYGFPILLEI